MGLPAWDAYQRGILTTSVLLNPTTSTFLTVKSHQIHIFRWRHPTKSQSNPIEKPFLDDEHRLQSHLLTIKSNQIPLYILIFRIFQMGFHPTTPWNPPCFDGENMWKPWPRRPRSSPVSHPAPTTAPPRRPSKWAVPRGPRWAPRRHRWRWSESSCAFFCLEIENHKEISWVMKTEFPWRFFFGISFS